MAGVIRWEEPPESTDIRQRYAETAQELRRNPKTWALIFEGAKSSASAMAQRIRTGAGVWGPAGFFEAKYVDRRCYARYVGESQ